MDQGRRVPGLGIGGDRVDGGDGGVEGGGGRSGERGVHGVDLAGAETE